MVTQEKETGLLPEEKRELDHTLKRERPLVLAKVSARLAGGHT